MPKNRKNKNRPNSSAASASATHQPDNPVSASSQSVADVAARGPSEQTMHSLVTAGSRPTGVPIDQSNAPNVRSSSTVTAPTPVSLQSSTTSQPFLASQPVAPNQASAMPKPGSNTTSAPPKSAWGFPSTDSSQQATVSSAAVVSPAMTSNQPSTVPKPSPNVPAAPPKSAWVSPSGNASQQSPHPKASMNLQTTGLNPPQQSVVSKSNASPASAASKSAWNVQPAQRTTSKVLGSDSLGSQYGLERSASAHPVSHETSRNPSVSSRDGGKKQERARSAQSARGRRNLRSAVPDSAVLLPVSRPDKGGSAGRPITVYANHFPVHIPDTMIYQYDVEILVIDENGRESQARKDERWEVMQLISQRVKDFPLAWYDEGKTLYSRELMTHLVNPIQVRMPRNDVMKTFQLKILNLVRQEKLGSIHEFVQGKSRTRPREAIRTIETLFKQTARNELVAVRNQFYDRKQTLEDLGDGRGMAKGFYQALFLTRCGPTLNVNLTFTCFYMPLNFVDFACQYLRRKDITTKGLSDRETKMFRKIIKDLLIETSHTGRPIRYKLRGFGLPANQLKFIVGDTDEGSTEATNRREITVAEYFQEKYKIKLRYPSLPCIDGAHGPSKKVHWIPMEIVQVVEWQRAIKPLDSAQRANVSSKSIIKADARYNQIMKIMTERNFENDRYLSAMNISVERKEMIELQARVLNPPAIHYRATRGSAEAIEQVNVGKWKIRNFFYQTPEIKSWGLIYVGHRPNEGQKGTLDYFAGEFPKLLMRKGFVLRSALTPITFVAAKPEIERALTDGKKKGWQLALIILNTNDPEIYPYIKQYGHQTLGLKTQCFDMAVIQRAGGNLSMIVDNVSQKLNAKLGGINSVVDTRSALKCSSKDDLFMFFGADVTHSTCSTDRPSIAAVVGSRDPTNTLYAARICEQYPKKGRCSVEIIKDLDQMVADLLRVYASNCQNRLPTKIIFYRDGVDEGHFQKVLDNEVTKIKNACRVVYGNLSLPKLTFIVVKKRHNTRFFLYENGRTLNVEAGTVIDQGITHPSQFDFYLCSQAAIMGTSRPSLYHVLHDDIGFSSDDIQTLTYWLCHTDMRCNKSVSIPAPVHYAHLAAYQARMMDFQDDRASLLADDDDDGEDDPRNYSIEDIATKLMILDKAVADTMWFL